MPALAQQLPALAQAINAAHHDCQDSFQQVQQAAQESLRQAKLAGEYLAKAKSQVGHGRWQAWMEENLDFHARTARRYLQIHDEWASLQATPEFESLSYSAALTILADTKPEPEVEAEIEPDVLDVEVIETPQPAQIVIGQAYTVTAQGHLHEGKQVVVASKSGQIAIADVNGQTYPFMPTELLAVEPPATEKPKEVAQEVTLPDPEPQLSPIQKAQQLLRRVVAEIQLPEELKADIEEWLNNA